MKKLIALILLISTPAFADQALPIKSGQPAPYDGVVLDNEKANKVKDQLIERDEFEKLNQSYQKSIDLYKANEVIYSQENSLLLNSNVNLSKELSNSRGTSDWVKVGYFVLGIAVVSAGVYGASRLK